MGGRRGPGTMAEVAEAVAAGEPGLRDRADEVVPGTLLAARAVYLITGDKDLLAQAARHPILTPAAFWERHGG
jgi:predicted nucleic acid-binding protein